MHTCIPVSPSCTFIFRASILRQDICGFESMPRRPFETDEFTADISEVDSQCDNSANGTECSSIPPPLDVAGPMARTSWIDSELTVEDASPKIMNGVKLGEVCLISKYVDMRAHGVPFSGRWYSLVDQPRRDVRRRLEEEEVEPRWHQSSDVRGKPHPTH